MCKLLLYFEINALFSGQTMWKKRVAILKPFKNNADPSLTNIFPSKETVILPSYFFKLFS